MVKHVIGNDETVGSIPTCGSMNLKFTKMHGIGNDFVVIDNMNGEIVLSSEQIIFLCDRHKGIGADGVILVEKKDGSDCFMNYYNSDGTLSEMCGNGVRCTALFYKEQILEKENNQNIFKIDTRAGIKEIKLENDGTLSVNMGKAFFVHSDFPKESLEIEGLNIYCVSMGNPHAVAFVDDIEKYNLLEIGPKIENNKNFANKINFELVERVSDNEFNMKVWERGCGATLACGTGACAVYALALKYQNAQKEMSINLPGGKLYFSSNENDEIIMTGPAVSVFNSDINLN